MIPFEMVEPTSLQEAMALLDPQEPTIRRRRRRHRADADDEGRCVPPSRLVCLHGIEPRYSRIALSDSGELQIGAMATLSEVEKDANVASRLPVLKRALRRLSNPRVRNVARVGGALAHGDPHMDLPPVLTMLGARVTIVGPNGERELPLEQLYSGYYETVLDKNELITAVTVPSLNGRKVRLHESHVARPPTTGPRSALRCRLRCKTARSAIRSSWSAPRRKKSRA